MHNIVFKRLKEEITLIHKDTTVVMYVRIGHFFGIGGYKGSDVMRNDQLGLGRNSKNVNRR